ncbi:MAG: hypothetical protein JKX76_03725 [Colwellia sp.]|nr:hypothetical protein [Colwellia sp.]
MNYTWLHVILVVTFFSGISAPMQAQEKCSIKIKIEEWPVPLRNIQLSQDTISNKFKQEWGILIIKLIDCRGAMIIEKYEEKGNIISRGSYKNGLDTLKRQVLVDVYDTAELKIIVEKYFEPLKDGIWEYFKESGELDKKVSYSNGIRVDYQK